MSRATKKGSAGGGGMRDGGGDEPLSLPRYRPELMNPDSTILFVGPRRTGKSTLVMDILYHMRHKIYAAVCQTPTTETAEELGKVIPWSCVHDDFDSVKLQTAVNAMTQLVKTERQVAPKMGRHPEKRILLVLLDDCMADQKNMKQKIIQDIFYNGRHYDLLFINVQQYIMDMPSKLRTNIDIIVSTYDQAPDSQERLWKYFFKTAFPRYDQFVRNYTKTTADFRAIILDRTKRKVYWYKAQHPPVWETEGQGQRLCHPSIWVMHCKYLRSRAEELKGDIAYISETVRKSTEDVTLEENRGAGAGMGAGAGTQSESAVIIDDHLIIK
jgi:hypothetical protein